MEKTLQPFPQICTLGIIGHPALYHHNRLFFSIRTGHRKGRRVPCSDFRLLFGDKLEILRPDVTAIDDNHILFSTGNKKAVFDKIAQIAGVKPSIGGQNLLGQFEIAKVTRHDTGSSNVNRPDVPLGQLAAIMIPHFNFVIRQGDSAIHKPARSNSALRCIGFCR